MYLYIVVFNVVLDACIFYEFDNHIIISGGNLRNIAVSARDIMWFMSEARKNTKPDSSFEVAVTCLLFPQSNRGVKHC